MTDDRCRSPLGTRYASPAMQTLWGEPHRIGLWRRLWLALAESRAGAGPRHPRRGARRRCGRTWTTPTSAAAARYERRFRHDVMAHVHAFGDQAPAARPFLHLGATSAFVTDNADLIVMRDGLRLLLGRLHRGAAARSSASPRRTRAPALPGLHPLPAGAAHHRRQARHAVDAGLRARRGGALPPARDAAGCRGCKGTTGTQASFLELFDGDHAKVRELERRVTAKLGFRDHSPVTGQTYPRKADAQVLDALSGIAPVGGEDGGRPPAAAARGRAAGAVRVASRSAPAPWPTSGTRCARSGSAALARFVISLQAERRPHRGRAVARAHARRQREPPAHAPGGLPRAPTRSWCSPPTSRPGSRCGRT